MQPIDYQRDITLKLEGRLTHGPRLIQIITGPRQIGKTTAIKQVLQKLSKNPLYRHHYATADLPAPPDTSWIGQEWERARLLEDERHTVILVLDEAQKVNRWSEMVKRYWDEDQRRKIRVVLLESSSLLMQKGLTESLAGRFEIMRCQHWSFRECAQCFGWDMDQYLYFGGYPGAASLIQDGERWASYVRDSLIETAISKDVLLLHPVEKPALLRKLFVLACEYAGQILSYQKMLGQLTDAGNTVTLANYQRLLEGAYLIVGLEKFSGSKVRKRSSSPKWLPLNTALITALSKQGFEESRRDRNAWGRLVECAVGAHLFYAADAQAFELSYWRESNHEVDYILQKGKKIIAIEVKSGRSPSHLAGLAQFEKKYKPYRSLVVGGTGIKVEEFLKQDVSHLFG